MKKISKTILFFVSKLEKHLQSNQYKDLFFEIRHILKNKIRLFSISVKLWFRFLYKIMTKQIVYLNNFARKSGFRLQCLRQYAFQTHHCWRGVMTSPMSNDAWAITWCVLCYRLDIYFIDTFTLLLLWPIPTQWHLLTPLGNKPLENTVGKGDIARSEQYLLFPQCFYLFWKTFCHFRQIWNCRLQTLSVWKSLKFGKSGNGLKV